MLDKEKIEPKQNLIRMLLTNKNIQYTKGGLPHHFLFGLKDGNEKIKDFITNKVLEKISDAFGEEIIKYFIIKEDPEMEDKYIRYIFEPKRNFNTNMDEKIKEEIEVPVAIRYIYKE